VVVDKPIKGGAATVVVQSTAAVTNVEGGLIKAAGGAGNDKLISGAGTNE
jgi:hypothetical protein